jgi:hypothetical protein
MATTLDQLSSSDYKLMQSLNTFNIKYAKYINCSDSTDIKQNCSPTDLTCCGAADKNINLSSYATAVNNDITELLSKFNNNNNKNNMVKPSVYDSSYNVIVDTEEKVKKLRAELDLKMKDMYNINNTKNYDSTLQYHSTFYSGILFTNLATTILYYTFTKL